MKGIRIRPEKKGLKASLFDLEAEIMEIVWGNDWVEFSVQDVLNVMKQGRIIAYTTVMTTVSRLYDKGLLTRRKEGRKYIYSPRKTRREFIEAMTRQVLQSLPPIGHQTAVALLIEQVVEEGNSEDLDRLEALIQERRKEKAK